MEGWEILAKKVIDALKHIDDEQGTYYAFYLDCPDGPGALTEALDRANKQLMWAPTEEGILRGRRNQGH